MLRLSLLTSVLAAALLAACGSSSQDLPQKPQIAPDRNALTFGGPVLATCVGTQSTDTPLLYNKGKDDLIISAVAKSGTNANLFTVTTATLPVTVTSNDSTFIRVAYAPTAAGTHTGKLTITSNAENSPTLELNMSATACVCNTQTGKCQ